MRLLIAAIGKMRGGAEAELTARYINNARQAGRGLGFSAIEIREFEPPKGLTGPARMKREAEFLLGAAQPGDGFFCLDENGKALPSTEFARTLARLRDDGARQAVFAIGGADGLDNAVLERSKKTIAFGRQTWPHMLVRVMLAEQIYRTMTILAGHPYHRS